MDGEGADHGIFSRLFFIARQDFCRVCIEGLLTRGDPVLPRGGSRFRVDNGGGVDPRRSPGGTGDVPRSRPANGGAGGGGKRATPRRSQLPLHRFFFPFSSLPPLRPAGRGLGRYGGRRARTHWVFLSCARVSPEGRISSTSRVKDDAALPSWLRCRASPAGGAVTKQS